MSGYDKTLAAVFEKTTWSDVGWDAVVSLLEHCGADLRGGGGSADLAADATSSTAHAARNIAPRGSSSASGQCSMRMRSGPDPGTGEVRAMLEYKAYLAMVQVDVDVGLLYGEVLGIRDGIAFEGRTVAEAIEAFHNAVDEYLDMCKEDGIEPEKPYSGKFLLRIDPDLHRRLALLAAGRGVSLNRAVADLLKSSVPAAAPAIPVAGRPASKPGRGSRTAPKTVSER
jgi:predicted HicB family RNase H-like nuclease